MPTDLNEAFEDAPSERPDGHARAPITAAEYAALPAPEVPCGYFTLTLTDGSQRRFRVRLERGNFRTGQRTLSIHCKLDDGGGQPEREWGTIGIVTANGFKPAFGRWRSEYEPRWAASLWALLHQFPAPGYSVEVEKRCGMTMRELTDADGLRTGLCRKWRKEFGIK